MWPPSPSAYARLRREFSLPDAFREGLHCPAEHLLQAIWQHQRLHRNRLKTIADQPVFILHPGFLNLEPGPDFRDAVVQVGNGTPQCGDIEVDSSPADWLHHKHHGNPAYKDVVLHVVWRSINSKPSPSGLPLLELASVLDSPLEALAEWMEQPSPDTPQFVEGKCAAPLRDLRPDQVQTLLHEAALFRLHARAEQLKARAREAGWTQAFWEGAFRALGYKHNPWPMLRLAELRPRWETPEASKTKLRARLLGLSGLLPSDIGGRQRASSEYVRKLWDCWWRDRDEFADCTLPRSTWQLAGIRPANHPQRRLALAAHWISLGKLPDQLRTWCEASCKDTQLPESLLKLLRPRPDAFWSHHYTLRSGLTPNAIPLLGLDRVTDLAANVILPWLWARANQGHRTRLYREVERRYFAWPGGPDNAVLKRARQRLFGKPRADGLARMSIQQGLLQVVRDFCDHSNSLCERCRFPELARHFEAL